MIIRARIGITAISYGFVGLIVALFFVFVPTSVLFTRLALGIFGPRTYAILCGVFYPPSLFSFGYENGNSTFLHFYVIPIIANVIIYAIAGIIVFFCRYWAKKKYADRTDLNSKQLATVVRTMQWQLIATAFLSFIIIVWFLFPQKAHITITDIFTPNKDLSGIIKMNIWGSFNSIMIPIEISLANGSMKHETIPDQPETIQKFNEQLRKYQEQAGDNKRDREAQLRDFCAKQAMLGSRKENQKSEPKSFHLVCRVNDYLKSLHENDLVLEAAHDIAEAENWFIVSRTYLWSPDGSKVAVIGRNLSNDYSVKVFDREFGVEVNTISIPHGVASESLSLGTIFLLWSPDSKMVAVYIKSQSEDYTLNGFSKRFHHNVSVLDNYELRIYSLKNAELIMSIPVARNFEYSQSFLDSWEK